MMRKYYAKILLALLALAICTGTLQAASSLKGSVTAVTLTCDSVTGPVPVQIGIELAAAGNPQSVTLTLPTGVVSPGNVQTGVNATTWTYFTVSARQNCNYSPGAVTLSFNYTGGTALTVNATLAAPTTANGSALMPSPSTVSFTCVGSTATPAYQAVNVISTAYLGTPFTVPAPTSAWFTENTTSGGGTAYTAGTASANGSALIYIIPDCTNSSLVSGLNTGKVLLTQIPAAGQTPAIQKSITVNLQMGSASTLSLVNSGGTSIADLVSLTFSKAAGSGASVTSAYLKSTASVFYSLDLNTLPIWLNVTPSSGSIAANARTQLTVTPTAGANTLAPGSYSATVHVKVTGQVDYPLYVTLQVNSGNTTLSVAEGTNRTIYWTMGTNPPSVVITPISTDSPIPYAVTTGGGQLQATVAPAQQNGTAYNFGSPFTVTFPISVFAGFSPGQTGLTDTVTVTGTGSYSSQAVVVTLTLVVQPPTAQLTSITPSTVPTQPAGSSYSIIVTGSGFVSNTNVGIYKSGAIVPDPNVVATYSNPNTMVLKITLPSSGTDPLLPFNVSGSVQIGVCNPPTSGSLCSIPPTTGGVLTLNIGTNPIIQAVTSASSYYQAPAPLLTPVSPYDMISIFGKNFCVSGGTGCLAGSSSAILYNFPTGATLSYLNTQLTPDTSANPRVVSVGFYNHSGAPQLIASAPLLFATNNQINALVPSALANAQLLNQPVDIIVSFGYGTGSTMLTSAPYTVLVTADDPGMFAMTAAGQGDAAALLPGSATPISSTHPASATLAGTPDTVQLYVTGLGAPDSTGASQSYGSLNYACMSATNASTGYFASLNSAVNALTNTNPGLTSDDGLIIQSPILTAAQVYAPCLMPASLPTVTIGGLAATVTYAGWVPDAVAGLYQINAILPLIPGSAPNYQDDSATDVTFDTNGTAFKVPVYVTSSHGSTSLKTGVELWVKRGLSMPAAITLAGNAGDAVSSSAATLDADSVTYSVSPAFPGSSVTLDANTGALGGVLPAATGNGTYVITATNGSGLVGTVAVTINAQ